MRLLEGHKNSASVQHVRAPRGSFLLTPVPVVLVTDKCRFSQMFPQFFFQCACCSVNLQDGEQYYNRKCHSPQSGRIQEMRHQSSQASLKKLMSHFFMARCAKWHFLIKLTSPVLLQTTLRTRYYKQNCALHCTVREKMIQNFDAIFCKANWNIASNRSAATIAFAR